MSGITQDITLGKSFQNVPCRSCAFEASSVSWERAIPETCLGLSA